MFTATRRSGDRSRQAGMSGAVWRRTANARRVAVPPRSASGMKMAGGIWPRTGSSHRASASSRMTAPLRRLTSGWSAIPTPPPASAVAKSAGVRAALGPSMIELM
jgi:RES domain-containing protein